jgi:S1-C subfamily serine protease
VNVSQVAAARISALEGHVRALEGLCTALLEQLAPPARAGFRGRFEAWAEVARAALLTAERPEDALAGLAGETARIAGLIDTLEHRQRPARFGGSVESLLLAVPRVLTFQGDRALTAASGFFFARDERLYLVTSRHVLVDEPSAHFPDRIEIELHADDADLSQASAYSVLLYDQGRAVWRQASDSGGEIDVAVLELERDKLGAQPPAFTPASLQDTLGEVDVGTPLLVVGFPLGFYDRRFHLPVARQASVASSFGTRFQGQGLFLTDARTHRGTSGAPVVMRDPMVLGEAGSIPWKLLGIHSSRMDVGGRDLIADESLGLNCAWYADVLLPLTEA